jgi:hypothetical protein
MSAIHDTKEIKMKIEGEDYVEELCSTCYLVYIGNTVNKLVDLKRWREVVGPLTSRIC